MLQCHGPITVDDVDTFRQSAERAIAEAQGRVAFDLAAVPLVDGAALTCLLDLADDLGIHGQSARLVSPSETVREILEVTGTAPTFQYFDDAASAARGLS